MGGYFSIQIQIRNPFVHTFHKLCLDMLISGHILRYDDVPEHQNAPPIRMSRRWYPQVSLRTMGPCRESPRPAATQWYGHFSTQYGTSRDTNPGHRRCPGRPHMKLLALRHPAALHVDSYPALWVLFPLEQTSQDRGRGICCVRSM